MILLATLINPMRPHVRSRSFRAAVKMCSFHTTGVPICKQLCVNFGDFKWGYGPSGTRRCIGPKVESVNIKTSNYCNVPGHSFE